MVNIYPFDFLIIASQHFHLFFTCHIKRLHWFFIITLRIFKVRRLLVYFVIFLIVRWFRIAHRELVALCINPVQIILVVLRLRNKSLMPTSLNNFNLLWVLGKRFMRTGDDPLIERSFFLASGRLMYNCRGLLAYGVMGISK
jgi:hypothetical protein